MKTLLILDFSNTVIRSMSVHKGLSFAGLPTGGIYGFISQLSNLCKRFAPDDFIVCGDSPPYLRKDLCSEYKSNRASTRTKLEEATEDDLAFRKSFEDSKKGLEKLFSKMNLPLWQVQGYEADDLIARIAIENYSNYERIVVVCNDSDLFQLFSLGENLVFWKNGDVYTLGHWKKEYDMEIKDWILYSSIVGTHNAVKGVQGYGKVKTKQLLKDPFKLTAFKRKYSEVLQLNDSLIRLPFKGLDSYDALSPQKISIERQLLFAYLSSYGINPVSSLVDPLLRYSFSTTVFKGASKND